MATKKKHSGKKGAGYRSSFDYSSSTKPKSPFQRIVSHYAERPWMLVVILFASVVLTGMLLK